MNFWTYFLFLQVINYLFLLLLKIIYAFYKLRPFIKPISQISSYVHETAHFLIAKLMGVQVRFRNVNYKTGSMRIYLTPRNKIHNALLKSFFISFAPGILSTIGIIRMVEYYPNLVIWYEFVIWWIFMLSLFWAVGISKADLRYIVNEFNDHPMKSFRQLWEIVMAWGIYFIWFDFFTPLLPSLQYLFEFAVITGLVIVLEFLQSVIKHGSEYIFRPRDRTGTATDFSPRISRKMNRQYAKLFFAKQKALIENPEELP